jgi:hypothetical protein
VPRDKLTRGFIELVPQTNEAEHNQANASEADDQGAGTDRRIVVGLEGESKCRDLGAGEGCRHNND